MARRTDIDQFSFEGFDRPESNWFRMPNAWTDITARITSIAELKVVEYILRHTWGYQEYGLKKHITIDEFVNGRRRQDGSRMDRGTGLSERAVYDGLRRAAADGLIEEDVDDSDRGRLKKYYSLRMRPSEARDEAEENPPHDLWPGVQTLHPPLQGLHPPLQSLPVRGAASAPRTEKDTQERLLSVSNLERLRPDVDNRERENGEAMPQATRVAGGTGASPSRERRPGSMRPIGELIERRRGRPPGTAEERELVVAYLGDFARELGDESQLSSTVSQAINIFKAARVPQERWSDLLYQARAITKEHSHQIKKKPSDPGQRLPAKIRIPYYMAVLRDLVGLREAEAGLGPARPSSASDP